MLFRMFELSGRVPTYETRDFIRFSSRGSSYSIVIGIRERNPTSRTKERIRQSVNKAWESLFDPESLSRPDDRGIIPPPYGLAIVPDFSPPAGELELPTLLGNRFYILFALLESENTSPISEDEEQSTHEELLEMITTQYSGVNPKPRIALVTLYNCSVQLLEGPGPKWETSKKANQWEW